MFPPYLLNIFEIQFTFWHSQSSWILNTPFWDRFWSFCVLLSELLDWTCIFKWPYAVLDRMNCELLATCSALGYLEGETYHKEADCLGACLIFIFYVWFYIDDGKAFLYLSCPWLFPACVAESVKDLIRYLRHEDDTRDVRQQLGAGQIVQNDLLPIIIQHGQDRTLFDACIRYEAWMQCSLFKLKNQNISKKFLCQITIYMNHSWAF